MIWLRLLPGVFKLVPREVWYVLAIAILYRGAVGWHESRKDAYGAERFTAGYSKAVEDGRQLQAQAEAVGRAISTKLKEENNATLRAIDRLGNDLRLRGPGKAICSYPPRAGAVPGGQEQASRPGNAAVDSMPDSEWQQLMGLPFSDTLDFAEQHDANRAEVIACRSNDEQQREARAKLQSQGTQP